MLGIMAPIAGSLSDRYGSRRITLIGLGAMLVGYIAITSLATSTTALGYIVRMLPIGLGMGIFQSPNNSAIMGAVPRERLGIASGLLSMTRTLGQTVGIAMMGAIWAGRVLARLEGDLVGGAITAPAEVQVAAMHDTFFVIAALMALALAVAVWGWLQERRLPEATRSHPQATAGVERSR
jgi:MFS family permease